MKRQRVDWTVLGGFGKAKAGAVHLSYGRSGGPNCDKGCSHFDDCYAIATEHRWSKTLAPKMKRHQRTDPASLTVKALTELHRLRAAPPWIRLSSFGSLPQPERLTVEERPRLRLALRKLATFITDRGWQDRTHIPVESAHKARHYRRWLPGLTVRESCQNITRFLHAKGPVSMATPAKGPLRLRLADARALASDRQRLSGRPTAVCGAIRSAFKSKLGIPCRPIKCGDCTLCAEEKYDIVYPGH